MDYSNLEADTIVFDSKCVSPNVRVLATNPVLIIFSLVNALPELAYWTMFMKFIQVAFVLIFPIVGSFYVHLFNG
jgi:hypothetical protein